MITPAQFDLIWLITIDLEDAALAIDPQHGTRDVALVDEFDPLATKLWDSAQLIRKQLHK